MAYQLALPPKAHIHPVFHIFCLKHNLSTHITYLLTLPPVDEEGAFQLEPKLIIDRCMTKKGARAITEVLVQWKGASREDSTWIVYSQLLDRCPYLMGKVL